MPVPPRSRRTYRNYTDEDIVRNAPNCRSYAELLRTLKLAPIGGNYRTIKSKIHKLNIDVSHMAHTLWSKGKSIKPLTEYKPKLNYKGKYIVGRSLKKALITDRGRKCELCGLTEWQGNPIPLEIHHIDRTKGNDLSNLQVLCCNCHSLTDTWRRP